jgi:hypothetical protein
MQLKISEKTGVMLDTDETTGEYDFKNQKNPSVCGVIVDKCSGHGFVQVSGGNEVTTKVGTGEKEYESEMRFVYVDILSGQTCMLYGAPTVLYVLPQTQSST